MNPEGFAKLLSYGWVAVASKKYLSLVMVLITPFVILQILRENQSESVSSDKERNYA